MWVQRDRAAIKTNGFVVQFLIARAASQCKSSCEAFTFCVHPQRLTGKANKNSICGTNYNKYKEKFVILQAIGII